MNFWLAESKLVMVVLATTWLLPKLIRLMEGGDNIRSLFRLLLMSPSNGNLLGTAAPLPVEFTEKWKKKFELNLSLVFVFPRFSLNPCKKVKAHQKPHISATISDNPFGFDQLQVNGKWKFDFQILFLTFSWSWNSCSLFCFYGALAFSCFVLIIIFWWIWFDGIFKMLVTQPRLQWENSWRGKVALEVFWKFPQ